MTCSRTKKRPANPMRETNTIREDEVSRKAQENGDGAIFFRLAGLAPEE